MRPLPILSAVLLFATNPVLAQVTVDLHALQALPEHPSVSPIPRAPTGITVRAPASAAVASKPAPAPIDSGTASASVAPQISVPPQASAPPQASGAPKPAAGGAPPAAEAAQPAMPETIPDTAMLTPVAPPPPTASPPPPPVSDKAATTAAPTTAGLRLSFGPGQSDLSPDSTASIKELAAAVPPGDATTFNVLAYAPGAADDPSTARRISLARAMAVRGALVADGVASAHIFVRALGAQYGDGPPDRVDLNVTGGNGTGGNGTGGTDTTSSAAPR
jgi:outer membrane protein OmpA-like peptidoglycan-associated protein